MKQLKAFVLLILLTAIVVHAKAQETTFLLKDDKQIEKLLKDNHIPALGVGIIKEGKLTQVKMFGELKAGTPAPYNTIFGVASLTKPVVAMLTLKLVDLGQWKLDEPLANYWIDPEVKNDPRHKKLTTRHVLSHQTGFPNWRWMHATKKLTFDFEPGTKFSYSGEGFEYLRKALEKKFKKPLDQLCDSLLFKPLGMTDSRFVWDHSIDESRFALWHDKDGNHTHPTVRHKELNAAANLLTTIEDYGRFGAWVINGAALSEHLFKDITTSQSTIDKASDMGLGWFLYNNLGNGEYAMLHTGIDPGRRTLILLFPKSKQGLIVMTNSDNGNQVYEKLISATFHDLGKAFIDKINER